MKDKLGKQLADSLRAFAGAAPEAQDKIADRMIALLLESVDSVQRRKTADNKHKYIGPKP